MALEDDQQSEQSQSINTTVHAVFVQWIEIVMPAD